MTGSPRAWRAAGHALVGAPLAACAGGVLGVLFILWGAAIYSLAEGPTGAAWLVVLYVVTALVGPVFLLWSVREFGQLQRDRFRRFLDLDIPEPDRPAFGPLLARPWRYAVTWRQLAYHLLALVIAPLGLFSFLGGPRAVRGAARLDAALASGLLGPSRADVLAHQARDLTARVEELARSRADIIAATDAERRRIERDLHDGAQQRLVQLALNLGMARESLVDIPVEARRVIEQAHDEATRALAELRDFVRGLHPAVMNDRGLDAALSGIIATAPIPVQLRVRVEPRCSPSIEAIAYFTVSEALTNVARHSSASRADVRLDRLGDRLRIVVTDDGRGGATVDGGSGLRGLGQRAAAVDGTLTVHSPPGGPTTLTVELPCE